MDRRPRATTTRDHLPDVTIDSSELFEAALTSLVQKADDAGVDVRGSWVFETRGSTHSWELVILELSRE